MRRLLSKIILTGVAVAMLASCSAPKKVPYIVAAEDIPAEVLTQSQNVTDPVITVGDLLNIEVTGINMSAMAPFNKGKYIDTDGKIGNMSRSASNLNSSGLEVSTEYYLVNSDGCIDFPIVGKVKVAGLTKAEVADRICNAIYPKYVTEKPSVDIRLMNFRVTVAGAVKTPGVYQSKNERMTFLEAIAMAGDLDIKGDRENILLYRTNADGTREVHRLDLHDRNFLLSPYYNLQQNDFIYVEPNSSMRQGAWQLNPAVNATITIVGGLSSVASLVIGILNLSK
ncbi:MAG: polysaccharide biosynthesis/export family protein [Muribaculaceae bacterium]|nr:polysaccharide biosynthesis/export family protein [Muribaculaceae bacterium]